MEDFEREIKCIVVGNGGVGKTSMIKRFCNGVFAEGYKKTIGVDFLEKQLHVASLGQDVRLYLWDTAGQEEFDSVTRTYYRGAGAAVLAFSTTDRASFEALPSWKAKVQEQCSNVVMALVQNKVDLIDQAVVANEEAEAMARRLGLKLYRTCVKQDLHVDEVFTYLVELHERKLKSGHLQQSAPLPMLEAGKTLAGPAGAAASPDKATEHIGGSSRVAGQAKVGSSIVTATITTAAQHSEEDKAGIISSTEFALGGSRSMPATIELQPTVKRGKKKLTTKLKNKAQKMTQCSIQ